MVAMELPKSDITIYSSSAPYRLSLVESEREFIQHLGALDDIRIIIDSEVSKHFPFIEEELDRPIFRIKSDESSKSLRTVESLCEWLIGTNSIKSTNLVAIGGGVVQDVATFVAHIYFRGLNLHLVPTTLLSQADSCLGSKCALNSRNSKNQIGVIHTPKSVLLYPQFLETLPKAEIRSGYGEILKLSITGPKQFFSEFEGYLRQHGIDKVPSTKIIMKSLSAKIPFIEADEYESDVRRVLNYGHSFGHALESLSSSQIVHGDAITVGMDLINYIGLRMGITEKAFQVRFRRIVEECFGHIKLPKNLSANEWVQELQRDKKMRNGVMNFAIPQREGSIIIQPQALDNWLINSVEEYLNECGFSTY
jgi:3-dehydroquinate synthase